MINSEIKKIKYNYNKIKSLYFGDILIWEPQEGMFDYNFSGMFNNKVTITNNILNVTYEDGSTEEVHIPYDNTIKEFDFDFPKPIKNISLPNRTIFKSITNFPKQSELTSCANYFYDCYAEKLYLSNFNTSNITDMRYMFGSCMYLTSLSLTSFDTSKVEYMNYMFDYCTSLKSIDLSSFVTSAVTNMSNMFHKCVYLTTINLSTFDMSAVTNVYDMFSECASLTTVTGAFEGTKVDLDLSYSPLTNESAMVFINGLTNVESTKTIKFKSSTYDTLTEEQIAVATSKGWTVVSV